MGPAVLIVITLMSVCQAETQTSCPRVPEPAAAHHPPLPAGQFRFPYNNDLIVHDAGDGCPDIDIDRFDNDAKSCPGIWQETCKATNGPESESVCKCGTPGSGGTHEKGCHECTANGKHHLERKPPNATAWNACHGKPTCSHDDMCGRYPPITRRQMIERALGWVSNGFVYGGGGAPETCGSEDGPECPQYSYEAVCNGIIEMAWKSDDTNKGPGKPHKSYPPNTQEIDCIDVKPGDFMHIGHHMQMFRRWVNGSGIGKQLVLYQMGGGWGKANAAVVTFSTRYNHCWRRPNIIGDEDESDGHYCSTHAETTVLV